MLPIKDIRRFQILSDEEWIDVQMGQLETGDEFRVLSPSGTSLFDGATFVVKNYPRVDCKRKDGSLAELALQSFIGS